MPVTSGASVVLCVWAYLAASSVGGESVVSRKEGPSSSSVEVHTGKSGGDEKGVIPREDPAGENQH